MLQFLQNLAYYMMVEVLEPNWHKLEEKLRTVATVDEVLRFHSGFLDKCLTECLLTNQHLLRSINKALVICLLFAENIERFIVRSRVDEEEAPAPSGETSRETPLTAQQRRQQRVRVESEHMRSTAAQADYVRLVRRFERSFDTSLASIIAFLRDKSNTHYDHHLANLGSAI